MQEGGIAGAGSVLVNISGSDKLGLHEVNEACSLIREAARREDVQVNFGVVLDELLADTVKVTVIATGFERGAAAAVTQKPAELEFPAAMAEPEPGPEPEAVEPPVPEPQAIGDDLDTPAYLRRDRLHVDR
jgi:cell division protein FtsZ